MNEVFLKIDLSDKYNRTEKLNIKIDKYLKERWANIFIFGCSMENIEDFSYIYNWACEYGINCSIVVDDVRILEKIKNNYTNVDTVILKDIKNEESIEEIKKTGIKVKEFDEFDFKEDNTKLLDLK